MKLAASLLIVALATVAASRQTPAPARVPVVVELFTSEGCSSCPPADLLLSKLLNEQPIAGAEIIPLGLHVTYWDQLGWKDAASLGEATTRQQEYGRVFGDDRIYTPQAVIDGRDELVGSDEGGLRRAVERAARRPHAQVTLSAARGPNGTIVAHVAIAAVPPDVKEKLRTIFAVTEDGLTSIVTRGENGGRTLRHDAVVRRLSSSVEIAALPAAWHRDRLRLVAIVQGEKTQRIVGAATARIE